MTINTKTTMQFAGQDKLDHEEMLLRCWRRHDYTLLAALSDDHTVYEEKQITDTRPTRRIEG